MKLSKAFVRPVMFLLFTWFLDAHTALPCLQTIKFYIKWRTTFSVAARNYNRENWSFDRNWQFQFLNCERPACSIVHMKLLEKLVVLLKLATITFGQGKFSYFSKYEIISLKHTERSHYRQLLKVLAVKVTWTIIVNLGVNSVHYLSFLSVLGLNDTAVVIGCPVAQCELGELQCTRTIHWRWRCWCYIWHQVTCNPITAYILTT